MKNKHKTLVATALTLLSINASAEVIHRDYQGYSVDIDCDLRLPIKYKYTLTKDNGNNKRINKFKLAPDVPKRCQQLTAGTYRGGEYDRGHQAAQNHLDQSVKAMRESNYMVNVAPQTKELNRGIMLKSEMQAECYRDLGNVTIIGGIFPNEKPANTKFLKSHGVITPANYWKVMLRKDRAIAYIFPNTKEPTKTQPLEKYITTIADIEERANIKIDAPYDLKHSKSSGWQMPIGCDLS